MLSLINFAHMIYCHEELIDFLLRHGVILQTNKCRNCGNIMNINKETLMFRCRKRHWVKNVHKKRVSVQCKFDRQVKTGTWFAKRNINMNTVCKIVACFLMFRHPREKDTEDETGLTVAKISDWFNSCQEACVFWAEKHSEKLGGPEHIVEIDEAKIESQKYNRGRLIEGNWVFGGYQPDIRRFFIVPAKDRTEDTLLTCIKEWVLPGTTIVLKCWKAHKFLDNQDFQYLKMNKSYNFVDPQGGIHTRDSKRIWREVLGDVPKYNTTSPHPSLAHFSEYLFKRVYSRLERIEAFFDVIAEIYPPKSSSEISEDASSPMKEEEHD